MQIWHTVTKSFMSLIALGCFGWSIQGQTDNGSQRTPITLDSYGDALPAEAIFRVGTSRLRHDSPVIAVGLTPNGEFLQSIGAVDGLRMWRRKLGKANGRIELDFTIRLRAAALSLNGKLAAFGGSTSIKIIDNGTRKTLTKIDLVKKNVNCLLFSPDDRLLVSGDTDGRICVWDVATGKLVFDLKDQKSTITALAFTADGTRLVSGSDDSSIRIWEMKSRKEVRILTGHRMGIRSLAISSKTEVLVSSGADSTIRIWSLRSGEQLKQLDVDESVDVTLSGDGKLLAAVGYNILYFWDAATGREVKKIRAYTGTIRAITMDAVAKNLITGGDDGAVRVWNISTGAEVHVADGHRSSVSYIAITPNGKALCSSSGRDQKVCCWDLRKFPHVQLGEATTAFACALSPDGNTLAVTNSPRRGRMRFTLLRIPNLTETQHSSFIKDAYSSIAYSPNGNTLACVDTDGQLVFFSAAKCIKQRTIPVFDTSTDPCWISTLVFSSDSKILAVRNDSKGLLRIIDVGTGKKLKSFQLKPTLCNFTFSPQRLLLAFQNASELSRIEFWDALHDATLPSLTPPAVNRVTVIAFSPDGKLFACGTDKGDLLIIDYATRKLLQCFQGHLGPVRSLAFFPNRKVIASGGDDTTILFWKLRE